MELPLLIAQAYSTDTRRLRLVIKVVRGTQSTVNLQTVPVPY